MQQPRVSLRARLIALFEKVKVGVGKGSGSTKGFPGAAAKIIGRDVNAPGDLPTVEFDNSLVLYDNPSISSATIEGVTLVGGVLKQKIIELPPASRSVNPINVLSGRAIEDLLARMLGAGQLLNVEVGWRSHRPEDTRKAWMCTIQHVNYKCPVESVAWQDLSAYCDSTGKDMPDEFVINIGHLFWRWSHRDSAGGYRLLPCFGEVSHQAEAYHKPGWTWTRQQVAVLDKKGRVVRREDMTLTRPDTVKGAQIQVVNLESHAWNELRKQCHAFGLSVRWGSGPRMGEFYERGIDPGGDMSMCPHARFGVPCYMPLPDVIPVLQPAVAQSPPPAISGRHVSPTSVQGYLVGIPGLSPAPVVAPVVQPIPEMEIDPDLPMPDIDAEYMLTSDEWNAITP